MAYRLPDGDAVSSFDIVVNPLQLAEIQKALDRIEPKANNQAVLYGEKEAAKFLKPLVRAAAPLGKTGNLRKGASYGKAKRDKPGYFVRFKRPPAYHRHLVIQGTGMRQTRKGANRGRMPANPFVAEVADQYGNQALDIAITAISAKLEL